LHAWMNRLAITMILGDTYLGNSWKGNWEVCGILHID
jgi:hypothetical protein